MGCFDPYKPNTKGFAFKYKWKTWFFYFWWKLLEPIGQWADWKLEWVEDFRYNRGWTDGARSMLIIITLFAIVIVVIAHILG